MEFNDIQVNKESLNYLKEDGFIFFTTKIYLKKNKSGKLIKSCNYPLQWEELEESITANKPSYCNNNLVNSYAINVEKTGLTVIDLDCLKNDTATEYQTKLNTTLYERLSPYCNFIVKTKKGLHMYFRAESLFFKNKLNYTEGGVDIITKNEKKGGCLINGFGSCYNDYEKDDIIYKYKVIKGGELTSKQQIKPFTEQINKVIYDTIGECEQYKNKEEKTKKNTGQKIYNNTLIIPFNNKEEEKEEKEKEEKKEKTKKIKEEPEEIKEVSIIELYKTLMDNINLSRFQNYGEWLTLQYINKRYDIPHNIYDYYNRKIGGNYDEEGNKRIMKGLKQEIVKNFSFGTLFMYLKEDNPDAFSKLQSVNNHIIYLLKNFNYIDITEYFYSHNKDKYIYDMKTDKFYSYDENNILKEQVDIILNRNIYNFFKEEVINKLILSKDQKKIATSFLTRLSDTKKTISKITNELKYYYELKEEFNKNFDILPFKNGLCYDISIMKFRNIEKSDLVSLYTNIDYKDYLNNSKLLDLNEYNSKKAEVEAYIKEMFETNEKYKYVMGSIGCALFNNIKSRVYIWSGVGGNGKTQLLNLINEAFNNETETIITTAPSTLFTKKNNESPNNVIRDAKYCRILSLSEPEESSFNITFLKSLTGDEKVNVRGLFDKVNTQYKPRYTPIISANNMPILTEINNAIERRIIHISFNYCFKETELTDTNDKKANKEFYKKFEKDEQYKIALIDLVLLYMTELIKSNYTIPKEILEDTQKYFNSQKFITEFLNRAKDFNLNDGEGYKIIKTGNNKDYIRIAELYRLYNGFQDTTRKFTTKEFYTQLTQEKIKFVLLDGFKILRGYKIIDDLDDL
jgi:phage/plasmid-associated DNA primase